MFSHAAGVAPAAGVTVAPMAPTRPGVPGRAQPGKWGTATLARAGKPGECEEDFCD